VIVPEEARMRRKEKEIRDAAELDRILGEASHVTLAMCDGDRPYLVTMSHGYDAGRRCLYFHCAPRGRKLDVLAANPSVYGQAFLDLGYQHGSCDHLFETVQFEGVVTLVADAAEKRHALEVMIRQLERDPEPVLEKQITDHSVGRVTIGRVDLGEMTGKRSAKVIVQL
jgi:uncharacterized protein